MSPKCNRQRELGSPAKLVRRGWPRLPGVYSPPPRPPGACAAPPRGSPMRTATLLPDANALHLEALVADAAVITIVVATTGDSACCPACGQRSAHRHSRRWRTIADLPWQGLTVRLELHFRRFHCDAPTCARRTFTERLPTVVAPYARRTRRLAAVLEAIAFALGGEAGARLLADLGLAASPDALLRVIAVAPPPAPAPAARDRDCARRRARRMARYEEVRALHRQGLGLRAVARRLGIGRATVRKFVRAETFPERRQHVPRSTIVTPYEAYLRERWEAGCQNAAALWRELRARGFTGSPSRLRQYLRPWRTRPGRQGFAARRPLERPSPAPPPAVRALSPRQAMWLVLQPEDRLSSAQQAYRTAVEGCCPEIGLARAQVHEFGRLVRERDEEAFVPWLDAADGSAIPELREFARGLRRDRAAVEAALHYEWSNGQAEGQVNRLKLLKRAMYGRAGFALLRRRVLRVA